ncbi:EAL domain-containing protein (putative c-di-GMP-specific phosphodiesterase class I) [Peribacillus deserti]|uniref:EAL domain-containing protein (Putative c-di-GMP-specific phosphodiesterase class I) n=1 Tax=Peribacillus deserti TaxID=673318 RepID=A0ABS2QN70_9BACI|nr:EAL domain-containing protein (putative c-di-GMP-specific phosphodiesterase class I) [Peribacillus deserti]
MDAVEILTNTDKIKPYFQPIFSADEHRVIGYEVLGRFDYQNQVISLGPFFNDKSIPEDYRLEIDNLILEMALEKMKNSDEHFLLFINRDPNLLMLDHGEEFLQLLQKHLELDDLKKIVLEISEADYKGELDPLYHMLTYFKTYGIRLAIDNLGQESHMDRIAQLSPHILKINMQTLNQSGDSSRDMLYSLGMLARKMGATLLFENIETNYGMHFAWKNGGRYYQGFYLYSPKEGLVHRDVLREKFKEEFHEFIMLEKKKLETIYALTTRFQRRMQDLLAKYKKLSFGTDLLKALGKELEHMCFRLYICDEDGFQKSPNLLKDRGAWVVQEEYRHKNWSWRPYFLENIIKMRNEKRGFLSDLYSDIETGETIRTFSYPLHDHKYLFLDLSYSFLYENEVLL